MNYPEVVNTAKNKFRTATREACIFAIADCLETLEIWKRDSSVKASEYCMKLNAEIDAARERIAKIDKMAPKPRLSESVAWDDRAFIGYDSEALKHVRTGFNYALEQVGKLERLIPA